MPIDPYAPNPFADRAKLIDPVRFEQVSAVKEPPKMFAGGTSDTPAFTASGIDPELLLRLPAGVRHAAAAEPDIRVVHRWFEEFAGISEAVVDHQGWRDAQARVEDWLNNTDLDTRTPEQRAADDEAEYQSYYNPENDRVAHANEQRRRAEAGEQPLEDFNTIQGRKSWQANMPTEVTQARARPPGYSDEDLALLAQLLRGGAS
ncbi:hypothetical protein [Nocardioides sp. cx-173]|uniref:hypothetical protein n=1 Tax=Nocardioides sp. cx-173 TaxID=2898796 RepID=UPI001E4CE059|nr:hypothetical protein [Nocardioides sp. cx-173]MCD4525238.1 hypothetical protein [Nocardioides sp. cx-173]UGB40959.1 hypothetical protein LQ940_16475 [Nocardioides sp. cx-173]